MNKSDRDHLSRVAALPCIVCMNEGLGDSIAEIHHIRAGQGRKRADHKLTLPLCPSHHRTGGYGIAFHAGPKEWQRRYGNELDLLEQVRLILVNS